MKSNTRMKERARYSEAKYHEIYIENQSINTEYTEVDDNEDYAQQGAIAATSPREVSHYERDSENLSASETESTDEGCDTTFDRNDIEYENVGGNSEECEVNVTIVVDHEDRVR